MCTDINYRIVELKKIFTIQERYKIKKYWNLFWLIPICTGHEYGWRTITKSNKPLTVRDAFNYDNYHFKSKKEAKKFLKTKENFPIYHYV